MSLVTTSMYGMCEYSCRHINVRGEREEKRSNAMLSRKMVSQIDHMYIVMSTVCTVQCSYCTRTCKKKNQTNHVH